MHDALMDNCSILFTFVADKLEEDAVGEAWQIMGDEVFKPAIENLKNGVTTYEDFRDFIRIGEMCHFSDFTEVEDDEKVDFIMHKCGFCQNIMCNNELDRQPGEAPFKVGSVKEAKTANCIANCKTGGFGYNVSYCESCGHVEIHASSCNNRHCPCCQAPAEQKWIMERNSELIEEIAYYHAIFTVPHELNSLIYENQELLYGLMFRCAADTLLTLCRDKKYLGATPGIVSVLHTQGQRLNFHLHIHTMLSGGGLTLSGQFVEAAHKGYFLPKDAMGRLYRGKFLEALKNYYDQKKLQFCGNCLNLRNRYEWREFIGRLYHKNRIPHIKETFNGFGNAVTYLARYVFRSAISNSRIDSVDDSGVTFHYKDYTDGGKVKSMHMGGMEFLDAFLMHVLPKGFCLVRFSGYLCNCQKTKKLKLIHKLRNRIYAGNPVKGKSVAELMLLLYGRDIGICPICHGKKIHLPRGVSLDAFLSRRTLTA